MADEDEDHLLNDSYTYCDICRINHTAKKRHVYSKKHQEKIKKVIKKFGDKIKEVRLFLQNPVIEEGACDESNNTFWCHMCKQVVNKHVTDHIKTIIHGGVVEHLASDEHYRHTDTFWRHNRLEDRLKVTFIISKVDLELYKKKLVPLVDEYDGEESKRTKQLASRIKHLEHSRRIEVVMNDIVHTPTSSIVYRTVRNEFNILQNPTGFHDNVRVWKGGIVKYRPDSDQLIPCKYNLKTDDSTSNIRSNFLYTVGAEGDGLTSIKTKRDHLKGNIHTGAIPPWLYKEEGESPTGSTIGPSQEDFDRHMEQVRKSKLNPNRVGANFDHSTPSIDNGDWLPSFGRVWNEGARWKGRKEFTSGLVRGEVENYTDGGGKKKKRK